MIRSRLKTLPTVRGYPNTLPWAIRDHLPPIQWLKVHWPISGALQVNGKSSTRSICARQRRQSTAAGTLLSPQLLRSSTIASAPLLQIALPWFHHTVSSISTRHLAFLAYCQSRCRIEITALSSSSALVILASFEIFQPASFHSGAPTDLPHPRDEPLRLARDLSIRSLTADLLFRKPLDACS